jgi:hypothetical protein
MLEMVALLVAGPFLNIHGFGRKVDEGLDPVSAVVAHADGEVLERDVVERMV